jgi:hypothetical protein
MDKTNFQKIFRKKRTIRAKRAYISLREEQIRNQKHRVIMSNVFTIIVPVLPGKTEQWLKFTGELSTTRKEEFQELRQNFEIRERSFLRHAPSGDIAIYLFEGENAEHTFQKLGKGRDSFTKWYFSNLKEIHGMDFTQELATAQLYSDSGVLTQVIQHL